MERIAIEEGGIKLELLMGCGVREYGRYSQVTTKMLVDQSKAN